MTRTYALERPVELHQIIVGCYLAMFLLGFATNIYGPALPYISAETNMSAAALGQLVVFHSLGFLASTFMANRLARRLDVRRALALAVGLVGVGMLGLIALPASINVAPAFVIGFGCGTTEILLNRLVEYLSGHAPAAELNRLHAMWGLGALSMPLAVAGVVALGFNWRAAGLLLFGVAVVTIWMARRWREFDISHGGAVEWRGLRWRSLLLFVLMFVIYVGAETSVGAWATTFFAKLGEGPFLGAIATSLFYVTFTIGRLALASLTERLGYPQTVRLGMLVGAAALALTLNQSLALLGFALAGVSYSVVFPTMFAWAARRHPDIRPQIASAVLASTGLGAMIIPYGIGWGVELLGAPALPPMLIVTSLLVSVLALFEPAPRGAVKRA